MCRLAKQKLNKANLSNLNPRRRVILEKLIKNMCFHGALCSVPFNLICNMTMPWTPPHGSKMCRVCGQNICYHLAAFVIPLNLICNMAMSRKTLNFDLLGGGGLRGKIFATILLHL